MARPKKRKRPLSAKAKASQGVQKRLGLTTVGLVPVTEAYSKKKRNLMRKYAREAASWPLYEVLISKTWSDPEQTTKRLVQIVVARRAPWGEIAAGIFLIDLACLGLKNGYVFNGSLSEYRARIDRMAERDTLVPTDLDTVAKVIREAVAYARSLGFAPHPDAVAAAEILGDADPERSDATVPLGGKDNKPFYFAGPDDDVKKVMEHLMKRLGPDGFHYIVHLTPSELEELGLDDENILYFEEEGEDDL